MHINPAVAVLTFLCALECFCAQEFQDIPPQTPDNPDPCNRRHHVEYGETCRSIAHLYGLKIEQLLLLNPGMQCKPFYAYVDLCIDEGATGRVLEDAVQSQSDFTLPSANVIEQNLFDADSPAMEWDNMDTGF